MTSEMLKRFFRFQLKPKSKPSSPKTPLPSSGDKVPWEAPLGLSQGAVEQLRHLESTPAWRHYQAALQAAFEIEATRLHSGLAHDEYLKCCGITHGLRAAYTLVPNILDYVEARERKQDDIARNARERTESAAAFTDLAFAGGPWWRHAQRPDPTANGSNGTG
jgi:hypothetical protein